MQTKLNLRKMDNSETMQNKIGFGSSCVQDPAENRTTTPHAIPIYASSSFQFDTIEEGISTFRGDSPGHIYGRFGNPTIDAAAEKIRRLECHGAPTPGAALMFSSGMAAISTLLMGTLKPGDKILTQGNLYGGTTELLDKIFRPYQVEPILTDLSDLEETARLLEADGQIRMIYMETPANPTLACVDLKAIADLASEHSCYTCVDNTFSTPYLQQPLLHSIDFVVHSTTKYLNGHGNSIAGALIGRDEALMRGAIFRCMKLMGGNCNAWDAWLTLNGMKTLEVRMERHCANAIRVAHYLEQQDKVARVNYIGLMSHPDHQLAKRQMRDFGGMLSFELKAGLEGGKHFMNGLQFCSIAPTLGDVDTLILHPASMSHLNVPYDIRMQHGITDGLIRISVGIEDIEDIIGDLERALALV